MSLSTAGVFVSYTGNGSTTTFAFPFRILSTAQLAVYEVTAAGVRTEKTLTTDYTVDVEDVGAATGGDVVFGTAPASGVTVIIQRETSTLQATSLRDFGELRPERVEDMVDLVHMIAQELGDNRYPRYTAATKPTADEEWDGRYIYVKDDAAGGQIQVCMMDSSGDYDWTIVAAAL